MRRFNGRRCSMSALLLAAGLVSAATVVQACATATEAHMAPQIRTADQASPAAQRVFLGVKVQDIDKDTAAALGLSEAKGALVTDVMPDGPAAGAGLKANDAILSMNGQTIADGRDLARRVAEQAPDSTVELVIRRSDNEQTVKVPLRGPAEKKAEAMDETAKPITADKSPRLGIRLRDGVVSEGVLIAGVEPNSDAAGKGLSSGDVILQVDGAPATSVAQVIDSVKSLRGKGREAVLLLVKSGEKTRTVAVRFSVLG